MSTKSAKNFDYEFGGPVGAAATTLFLPVMVLLLAHFSHVGSVDLVLPRTYCIIKTRILLLLGRLAGEQCAVSELPKPQRLGHLYDCHCRMVPLSSRVRTLFCRVKLSRALPSGSCQQHPFEISHQWTPGVLGDGALGNGRMARLG